jgi:hypothetical protein
MPRHAAYLVVLASSLLAITGGGSLEAQARLSGLVISERGEILPDARIEIVQGETVIAVAATDAFGGFAVPAALEPGEYVVRVQRQGFVPLERTVVLEPGDGLSVTVRMREDRPMTAPPPPTAAPRPTGHDYLIAGDSERPGFGLYSYLLAPSPPATTRREAFLAAIGACQRMTAEIGDLLASLEPAQLNVLYLPVREAPLERPTAEWVLEHYNHGRAALLIGKVPRAASIDGLYLVSTLEPLTSGAPARFLWQDLSSVPAAVIPAYIGEFKRQAARTEFWEANRMQQWVLGFRTAIEHVGESVPDLRTALALVNPRWFGGQD